jgi:hypothetical protein
MTIWFLGNKIALVVAGCPIAPTEAENPEMANRFFVAVTRATLEAPFAA